MKKMREDFRITITKMLRSLDLFDNIDKLVFVTDRQGGKHCSGASSVY